MFKQDATPARMIALPDCQSWSYTTLVHHGTCVLDGSTIRMRFRLNLIRPAEAPDVLEVEHFCREIAMHPDTLEGYVVSLATRFGGCVQGKGRTKTHGLITCEIYMPGRARGRGRVNVVNG